jgi:hypothetical protein
MRLLPCVAVHGPFRPGYGVASKAGLRQISLKPMRGMKARSNTADRQSRYRLAITCFALCLQGGQLVRGSSRLTFSTLARAFSSASVSSRAQRSIFALHSTCFFSCRASGSVIWARRASACLVCSPAIVCTSDRWLPSAFSSVLSTCQSQHR